MSWFLQIRLEIVRRTRLVPFRTGRNGHLHCLWNLVAAVDVSAVRIFFPLSSFSPLSLYVSIKIQDICSCICGNYCWNLYMRRDCKAFSSQHLLATILTCQDLQSHVSFAGASGGLDDLRLT